jgi:hypothetical protein
MFLLFDSCMQILMLCGYKFFVLMGTCVFAWVVYLKILKIYCVGIVVLHDFSVLYVYVLPFFFGFLCLVHWLSSYLLFFVSKFLV